MQLLEVNHLLINLQILTKLKYILKRVKRKINKNNIKIYVRIFNKWKKIQI